MLTRPSRLLVLFAITLSAAAPATAQLRIFHIDVENADATLFVAPGGQTLLIDSGNNGHGTRIKAVMDQAGVSNIDHYVTTHYHTDHYGGIDELAAMGDVTIGTAYDRGDKNNLGNRPNTPRYQEYDESVGEDAVVLRRGDRIQVAPNFSALAISHGGVVIGEVDAQTGRDENDMSISLLIDYHGFRAFVGGDITAHTEAEIAARDLILDVDLYQANHHGSHSSSTPEFMRDLTPTLIVISNGSRADYQHPRAVTLTTYRNLTPSPTVLQTNEWEAAGTLGDNVGQAFIADLDPPGPEGTILVTVDETAGTFQATYRSQTQGPFTIKNPAGGSGMEIESALPDPAGRDSELEEVTLRNTGSQSESMAGWSLRDASGLEWDLTAMGQIDAGDSQTIVRNGQRMSLNNSGDTIRLLDAGGSEVDTLTYQAVGEGVRVP